MTITLRKAVAGLAAAGSMTLAGAAPALAGNGPVNAPTAVTGTFVCFNSSDTAAPPVASGTYVINAGKAKVQTWESAKLTFDSGGTGVFIQTASALGTPTVFKGSATPADPGPLQCSVYSPPGTPIGTVWGKIVTTG
jgi:hypothetical protein